MNRPTPKSELIITKGRNEAHPHGWLEIRFYSSDAKQWIKDHGREFSIDPFWFDTEIERARSMNLYIDPNYDIDEVKAYLESYLE